MGDDQSDNSDFLDKVASAEPTINVLPSPRPSKGGLLVQSGSMDGFYLVSWRLLLMKHLLFGFIKQLSFLR
jgi:hypothetical protein